MKFHEIRLYPKVAIRGEDLKSWNFMNSEEFFKNLRFRFFYGPGSVKAAKTGIFEEFSGISWNFWPADSSHSASIEGGFVRFSKITAFRTLRTDAE